MTYPPQQPENWSDPSWPQQQQQPQQQPYDPTSGAAGYAHPSSGAPGYPDPAYQAAQPGAAYPQPYAQAYPAYGYGAPMVVASQPTNGMAIASLVVSLAGMFLLTCYGVGGLISLVGAILGHVARKQIRERGEGGDGMALAGVIVGWISTALSLIIVALVVVFIVYAASTAPSDPYPYST